jgi:hypothetical protein
VGVDRARQERLARKALEIVGLAPGSRGRPDVRDPSVRDGDRPTALEAPVDQDEVGSEAHRVQSAGRARTDRHGGVTPGRSWRLAACGPAGAGIGHDA